MRLSQLDDILKHKYRGGEDPKKIRLRRNILSALTYTASVVLTLSVTGGVMWATGMFKREKQSEDLQAWATPDASKIQFNVIDRSSGVKEMRVDERRINQPSIYGHEMLFSAGTGSLDNSILTNLYLFNAVTEKVEKIAQSKIKDGEIFETYLSENWIVWVDTDHKGKNVIYKMNRKDVGEIKANTVSVVQEAENHMPRLGLYGDYLVWMEQVSDTEDQLYFVDLNTDENMSLKMFTSTNYAVSAPFIYKNTVMWADDDPDSEDGNISAIYSMTFDDLGESTEEESEEESGEIEPDVFKTNTYVHKPICNDEIYVWIDKNNAPDSNLYYAYKSGKAGTVKLWNNVTQFSVGEDFIVFVSNQVVYAYYYDQGILLQVSEANCASILPQAFGTLVVWEDKTDTSANDLFKYNIMG